MRSYAPLLLMAVVGLGCHSMDKCNLFCDSTPCDSSHEHSCPSTCSDSNSTCTELPAPCSSSSQSSCAQAAPQVEFHAPQTVHVKAPAQRVVVNTAAPEQAPPQAAYVQSAPVAQSYAVAQAAPVAATAFSAAGPASIQTVSANRARLAVGFDTIRLPVPFLRFYAVPTSQEITMPVQQSFVQSQAFPVQSFPVQQTQAFAVQAQAAPVPVVPVQAQAQMVPVQAQAAPTQLIPVQAQAQAQMVPVQAQAQMVPVQPQITVQAQSAPVQMIPVQAQAQMVPIQPQAAMTQMVPVQPQAMPCPACPPCPQCSPQNTLTQQKLDEYGRQVETLKQMLKERCAPPPACAPAPCAPLPCDQLCNPPPPCSLCPH